MFSSSAATKFPYSSLFKLRMVICPETWLFVPMYAFHPVAFLLTGGAVVRLVGHGI